MSDDAEIQLLIKAGRHDLGLHRFKGTARPDGNIAELAERAAVLIKQAERDGAAAEGIERVLCRIDLVELKQLGRVRLNALRRGRGDGLNARTRFIGGDCSSWQQQDAG